MVYYRRRHIILNLLWMHTSDLRMHRLSVLDHETCFGPCVVVAAAKRCRYAVAAVVDSARYTMPYHTIPYWQEVADLHIHSVAIGCLGATGACCGHPLCDVPIPSTIPPHDTLTITSSAAAACLGTAVPRCHSHQLVGRCCI